MFQKSLISLGILLVPVSACLWASSMPLSQAESQLISFSWGEKIIKKLNPIIEELSTEDLRRLQANVSAYIDTYQSGTFYRAIFEYILLKLSYEIDPTLYDTPSLEIEMKVMTWSTISVEYAGYLSDGTQFDSSYDRGRTLDFTAWIGQMIAGFDAAVIGMQVWETKRVIISPEAAYGEYDAEKAQYIPREELTSFIEAWFTLEIGEVLPTQFGEFTIIDSNSEGITINTNHYLAGKTLTFDIEIISIEN
jgi:FKBP-type peptidyl-prolyl cis-trans isomerase 2